MGLVELEDSRELDLKNQTSICVTTLPEHAHATVTGDAGQRGSRHHEGPLITDSGYKIERSVR